MSSSLKGSFSFCNSTDSYCDMSGSLKKADCSSSNQEFNMFSDGSCGEPFVAQHVRIDFTPNEKDNEIIQEKACSFWKFVNDTPEIQNLMALPERGTRNRGPGREGDTYLQDDILISSYDSTEAELKPDELKSDNPELSLLEFVDEKACVCKIPCSSCQGPMQRSKIVNKTKKMCKEMEEWDARHLKSMEAPGHPPSLQHAVLQRPLYHNY